MLDQTFSRESIQYSFRKSDFDYNLSKEEIESFKNDETDKCMSLLENWSIPTYKKGDYKGRCVYSIEDFSHRLIIRRLCSTLKKLYPHKAKSRDTITRELIPLLDNPSSYQVIRLDLRHFYSSIYISEVVSKIRSDNLLNGLSIKLLERYLNSMEVFSGAKGLMQGHPLSAILSEVFMLNFDKILSRENSVVMYERFVDDIIIVRCSRDFSKKTFFNLIKEILPGNNMSLNQEKCVALNIPQGKSKETQCFTYLGYHYSISKKAIEISVDKKKIRKMKNKISFSIKVFNKRVKRSTNSTTVKRELKLLIDSFKVLSSSNIFRKGHKTIGVGTSFNYKFSSCSGESFRDVDLFLQSIPYLKKNKEIKEFNEILQKNALKSFYIGHIRNISFERNFKKKVYIRLSKERVKGMWETWKYA